MTRRNADPSLPATVAPLALDAASVLARMDNPDLNVDAIIENIARVKGG